jgi:thiamine pyrophosphate-dependent acetolactate synthase large subunit-like protein
MVAMSMADGFARVTGKPQCVIVHVDVGTQALGCAVHNASVGRSPVLIFAGVSPITLEGEMRGSRTEFIHWLQDVPDQKQIVAQYCRYTAEIKTGKNIKQVVNRALQFARSEPAGPVYLCGAREIMEEEITPYNLQQEHWGPIEPAALSSEAVKNICEALVGAHEPLIITGYSGKNPKAPEQLVKLADTVKGLQVLDTGGSAMSFPANHRGWLSVRYGVHDCIKTADVILVLDCDVPWIPTQCKPSPSAKIFHIDMDPLKQQMPLFYLAAVARYRADGFTALRQLNEYLAISTELSRQLNEPIFTQRWDALAISHSEKLARISELARPHEDGSFGATHLCSMIRKAVPSDTIFCIEAVTNTFSVADNIQATLPGSFINCGAGGLGWSGGAALGMKLASEHENGPGKGKFVCQIVGDGTYMFSLPSSVYWVSQRYKIPVLTIVLNNHGQSHLAKH